jgi:hypothetical protein
VSVHDDDILDFDFVEDATQETPPPRRGGGGGGRGPVRPPRIPRQGPSMMPLLRLVGLIGAAIVIVVLLVLWGEGCSGDGKRASYNDFMTGIGQAAQDSAQIGVDLASLLTTPGLKQTELEQQLSGLVQRQQLDVQQARSLDAPGPLTPAADHAIEALQLRANGLQGLLATFKATASEKDSTLAGTQLAVQAKRLSASDVIWEDLFQGLATQIMTNEDVTGVTAPASVFVKGGDLFGAEQLKLVHERIHGATTGGSTSGIHGSAIEGVKVLPGGDALSTDTETTVKASTALGFEVSVKNSGESQEVQVEVTLTIPAQPSSIVKKGVIELINPGEVKTVVFKDFPEVPFGEKTTVQVSVKPVPGESNTTNNSYEYPVVFSL